MKEITKQTLRSIRRGFYFKGLYKTNNNTNFVCPHVNALVNIGLVEFGYLQEAIDNIEALLKSSLYDKKHRLFYREANADGEITNFNFNACKNALMALALYATGKKENANEIIDVMFNSLLFDKKKGLFFREYNNNKINSLIITQTNLWIAIALSKLNRITEAKQLVANLANLNLDNISNMFFSHDREDDTLKYRDDTTNISGKTKYIFADDQALAVIAYSLIGENKRAKEIINNLLSSDLYDSSTGLFNRSLENGTVLDIKSTYKNSICGIALGMIGNNEYLKKLQMGLEKYLYDKNLKLFNMSSSDNLKIPDNSMLALLAMEYDKLRHIIF